MFRTKLAVLAATSLLALATYASAADLVGPVVKGPIAPVAYDWSGVYVGGHIGGGWEHTTFSDPGAATPLLALGLLFNANVSESAAVGDNRASSFLGGVQAGWMYQIGRLVVGSDFDWSWTRLNSSGAFVFPTAFPKILPLDVAAETYSVSTKWTGTATTSIGIARDRWMLYSKAGMAWARHEYTLGLSGFAGGLGAPFAFGAPTAADTRVGWTVGTGVKWAFANNWFLNVEYDYMDFGSKAQTFATTCASPASAVSAFCGLSAPVGLVFSPTFNHNISEVKAGLNYKFPSGSLFFW
jgi:outer membrane immunogenic protein